MKALPVTFVALLWATSLPQKEGWLLPRRGPLT